MANDFAGRHMEHCPRDRMSCDVEEVDHIVLSNCNKWQSPSVLNV